jgi:hypothetical protein
MLADVNRKISIIAYYLSKFNMDAVRELGYENYSRAFEGLSQRFGKNNNYMKLRRDEFDVFTTEENNTFKLLAKNKNTDKIIFTAVAENLK